LVSQARCIDGEEKEPWGKGRESKTRRQDIIAGHGNPIADSFWSVKQDALMERRRSLGARAGKAKPGCWGPRQRCEKGDLV